MKTFVERSFEIILLSTLCLLLSVGLHAQQSIELICPIPNAELRVEHTEEIIFAWSPLVSRGEIEYQLIIAEYHEEEDYNAALLYGEVVFEHTIYNETEIVFPLSELPLEVGNLYVWTVMASNIANDNDDESSNYIMAPAQAMQLSHLLIRNPDGELVYYDEPSEGEGAPEGQPTSSCYNGKFELNSFANWTGKYGGYNNLAQNGFVTGRHSRISSPGFDPHVPSIVLLPPGGGNVTAKLGNDAVNSQSESLTYAFNVNTTNQNFLFRYAVILEDPGSDHDQNQRPYFKVNIYETVGNTRINWFTISEYADPNNPYFKTANSAFDNQPLFYRNWTCEAVDLSAHLGKTLHIEFITADCSLTGHYGYAYIDGVCLLPASVAPTATFDSQNLYCFNDPVIIDASASTNVTDYTVCVQPWANSNPAGPEFCETFFGVPGSINIGAILASAGQQFACGTSYRIKLEVSNACSASDIAEDFFYVLCPPPLYAGPDVTFCAGNGSPTIGPANTSSSYTYSWSPAAGLSDPNIPNPQVTNTTPSQTVYTLTRTDISHGCSISEQVIVTIFDPGSVAIIGDLCQLEAIINPSPFAPPPSNITWSTGQTGSTTIPTSSVLSGNVTYTVTVEYYDPYHQTTCSATGSRVVYSHPSFHWPLPGAVIPSAFSPNGDNINDIWYMGAYNPQWNPGDPYYGATEYQLRIFYGWGGVIYDTGIVTTSSGFLPFDIEWDGRDNNGIPLPEDVYVYQVTVSNCIDTYTQTATITLIR